MTHWHRREVINNDGGLVAIGGGATINYAPQVHIHIHLSLGGGGKSQGILDWLRSFLPTRNVPTLSIAEAMQLLRQIERTSENGDYDQGKLPALSPGNDWR